MKYFFYARTGTWIQIVISLVWCSRMLTHTGFNIVLGERETGSGRIGAKLAERGTRLTEFANISGFWLASNLSTAAVRNRLHLNPKFIANAVAWSMIRANIRRLRICGDYFLMTKSLGIASHGNDAHRYAGFASAERAAKLSLEFVLLAKYVFINCREIVLYRI